MKHSIDKDIFFKELHDRGITNLFHANSVETSISFFRVAALLSRHQCIEQHLPQSDQWTDRKDKAHNIFDDIFLNFSDFHYNFKCANSYGPILFCINVNKLHEFLNNNQNIRIHLTQSQPHTWHNDTNDSEKWRPDMKNLFRGQIGGANQRFINGWGDIVLSGIDPRGIPLDVCDKVKIDEHPNSPDFFNQIKSVFDNCMKGQNLTLNITKRNCTITNCTCDQWSEITSKNNEHKYVLGAWTSEYDKIA